MTDLKQEISRIQNAAKENQGKYPGINIWYEIVKVAYERGELINLLSGDDEYIYDGDGKLWLKPELKLNYTEDNIAIEQILKNGIYVLYRENRNNDFITMFKHSLTSMLHGSEVQIYFAIKIFGLLSEDIAKSHSPFYSFIKKEQLTDSLRPCVINCIKTRKTELKLFRLYDCISFDDGLYGYCKYISNILEDKSIIGFVEG